MVLPHLGPMPLSNVQPATLRSWVAELDAGGAYAPATIRKAYQLASAALGAAVAGGLIPKSPARCVGLPKAEHHEMRLLAGHEIAALADAIDPRYRALVLCASYTGLRFGELAALRIERVDFLRRSLRVEETLTEVRGHLSFGSPKTKASRRSVSLPALLVEVLAAHIAEHGSDSGLTFTSPEGKPLRRTHFRRRVWKPAVAASVGEPCRVHDLRHSHAALLIAQGEHPKVIQSRLGHASITTSLNTYGHLFDGLDEAAADRLDDGFGLMMWTECGHMGDTPLSGPFTK